MSNGNGPIVKAALPPLEFGALGLPVDPLLLDLERNPSLEQLGTPQAEIRRHTTGRASPNLRPLRLQDPDPQVRLEAKATLEKRARARLARNPNLGRSLRGSSKRGILKNPYYPYEGGPLTRVMLFLANLLKHLEQLLLSRLKRAPTVLLARTVIGRPKKPEVNSVFSKEELEKLELKRKRVIRLDKD